MAAEEVGGTLLRNRELFLWFLDKGSDGRALVAQSRGHAVLEARGMLTQNSRLLAECRGAIADSWSPMAIGEEEEGK